MVSYRVITVAALLGMTALSAAPVRAQNALGGKVAGVCMLSRDQVLAQSKVGQAMDKRMQQLGEQANTQIGKMRDQFQKDVQAYQKDAQTMQPQQRDAKEQQLNKQGQQLKRTTAILDRRLQLTRMKAMQEISKAANPLVEAQYKSRGCGILLDRDAVISGNADNDLTEAVIKALDAKMSTISFSLAPMPTPPASK